DVLLVLKIESTRLLRATNRAVKDLALVGPGKLLQFVAEVCVLRLRQGHPPNQGKALLIHQLLDHQRTGQVVQCHVAWLALKAARPAQYAVLVDAARRFVSGGPTRSDSIELTKMEFRAV